MFFTHGLPLEGFPGALNMVYKQQAAVLAAVGSGLGEFMNAHVRLLPLGVSSLFPAQCSGHNQSRKESRSPFQEHLD